MAYPSKDVLFAAPWLCFFEDDKGECHGWQVAMGVNDANDTEGGLIVSHVYHGPSALRSAARLGTGTSEMPV